MRALAALLLLAPLGAIAVRQGAPTRWKITDDGELVWGGAAFRPSGGTSRLISIVGPNDLASAIANGDKGGKPYLIRMVGSGPMARGWTVRPQSYRAEAGADPITVSIPGADSVLFIVAAKRDGTIERRERVATVDGRATFDPKLAPGTDSAVILAYPLGETNENDLWEGWDKRRDEWVGTLRTSVPGSLFRGVIDPAGRVMTGEEYPEAVPTSPVFRNELRNMLEERYRNLDTGMRGWGLNGGTVESFEELARLVPLWNGSRGLRQLYDPVKDRVYPVDSRSVAWTDVRDALRGTVDRRHSRLVGAIKSVVDVPVLTTWRGWGPVVEDAEAGYDGLVGEIDLSSPSKLTETAARPLSSAIRRNRPTWLLALAEGEWKDDAVGDLAGLGYAGVLSDRTTPPWPSPIRPRPVFFPEAAVNPAAPQRLPGGRAWLPAPVAGAALDLGPDWYAYRMSTKEGNVFAIWTTSPTRCKFLTNDAKTVVFEATDGTDPAPKIVKGGVELNVGTTPVIVKNVKDMPVPAPALDATKARVAELFKLAEKNKRPINQERVLIERNLTGLETNPGGNFLAVRGYLDDLEQAMGGFLWAETEASRNHTFGELRAFPGCSGGASLSLQNRLLQDKPFFAEYRLPVRSPADQTLYIALRTGTTPIDRIKVMIGSQVMLIDPKPFGRYGADFAWYACGLTKLAGGNFTLRIEVPGDMYNDLQIDALVLTPGSQRPDGTRMIRG